MAEGEVTRPIPPITKDLLIQVKSHLLKHPIASRLAALIQLNTGMRISEPVLARLDDLVLDHEIPHIWVRRNELTDRKTLTSIRCIPLLGVSLDAARELHKRATEQKSEWLIPQYANEIGNSTCSATLNKCMKHLNFRTHMFRHAFIDRLKGCGDIVEWHPKLSHFEENLHPNLSHPNRLSCLIFEQGWARSDQRGNFEQITQTCPSRQGLHPAS